MSERKDIESEERDPLLTALFAQREPPPDGAAFVARMEATLKRVRRVRALRRAGVIVALALVAWWVAPTVIDASVEFGDGLGALMQSGPGWVVSGLVGAWVAWRGWVRAKAG